MALEIRELVIQAQMAEGTEASSKDENLSTLDSEQMESILESKIHSSLSEMRDEIARDMKIWIKEYMRKQQRKY